MPRSASVLASDATSDGKSVRRLMSRPIEKPQYVHVHTHSLLRYSGANRQIVLPKRVTVARCAASANDSSSASDAGDKSIAASSTEGAPDRIARCTSRASAWAARCNAAAIVEGLNSSENGIVTASHRTSAESR